MTITINGQARSLNGLVGPVELGRVVEALELKGDRVAIECNGEIAPRAEWGSVLVKEDDRLEIVHFVGGGCGRSFPPGLKPHFPRSNDVRAEARTLQNS